MPSFCAVLGCVDKYGHSRTVPFHKFPTKNKELLEKWIDFTQRPKYWRPSQWTSVCGLHFRDVDYRCLEQKKLLKKNAVPSVPASQNEALNSKRKTPTTKPNFECNIEELEKVPAHCESSPNTSELPSVKCRFCGCSTSSFESFESNFEIFGVIQKCLPTLSIRQDDDMPKETCCKCLKSLESFAQFIDKVLETQATLLRQFRQEKGTTKAVPIERALKIKQEPVVRVKQENFEDVNALFPDDVDEGVEQENDASATESQLDQKIQFCDFPVLNDQDLINNCDIMEIINLSDPFIDITNCENTLAEEEDQQQQDMQSTISRLRPKTVLQSAHELLQSHMLIEEHNYAFAAEDFKEEWQIKNCYKTEKVEAEDYDDHNEQRSFNCDLVESDPLSNCNLGNFIDEINAADVAAITEIETTTLTPNEMERSIKPIVTSVSSFNESPMANYPTITTFPAEAVQQPLTKNSPASRKRPNIVVLNESIVQSSHTFQLQACSFCQSKFIGVDSLNQHYATAHSMEPPNTPMAPMVTVPTANITATTWPNNLTQQPLQLPAESCKVEKDAGFDFNSQQQTLHSTYNSNTDSATVTANIDVSNKRCAKNEIKILDMQQSFLHEYNYPNLIHFEQQANVNFNATQINSISAFPLQQTHTAAEPEFATTATVTTTSTVEKNETVGTSDATITTKYLALQKSYERLRLKCQRLATKTSSKKTLKHKQRFQCRNCYSKFSNILQLLRHRQSAPFHTPQRRRTHFSASCPGCEKFFCHKRALFNHMRFICQSLPLSWFKCQLRSFKCRYCRLITFTHWRLYRRHEIKCRQRRKFKLNKSQNSKIACDRRKTITVARPKSACNANTVNHQSSKDPTTPPTRCRFAHASQGSFTCSICEKVFPTSSSLNQHRITHSTLRSFECEICKRIFKRRNGLTQHVRGYHLKLKPFECAVCKRSYALKGDAKRCKHSAMNRRKIKNEKNKKTVQ